MHILEQVFGVICGGIAIIVGSVVFIKRKAFTKMSSDAQRATFGRAGDKVAARANPGWTGAVGIFFVVVGVALIIVILSGAEI